MPALIDKLRSRFKRDSFSTPAQAAQKRIKRRNALLARLSIALPYFQLLLAVAGYLQYLVLPLPITQIARRAFVDENAVQAGQVNTYWTWSDVTAADKFAAGLVDLRESSSNADRSAYIAEALREAGLQPGTQDYRLNTTRGAYYEGTNTYARITAPKTSGSEVVVLCAPWKSRQEGMSNVRGTATLLAMAKHLSKLSIWSKDIILLFSDGNIDGVQAWISTYYGHAAPGFAADSLHLAPGSVWTALVVDYPYHSFSHLGLYYDGVNGRLPNLDLIHAASHVARWIGGVPLRLHNQTYNDPVEDGSMSALWDRYQQRARGLLDQASYGAATVPSGPEGLFGQYGIDALAFFGVPAEGPHGFHALGRTIEATLRATNNLIERFHASFFIYLLPEPFQFLSLASYLSAPLLVGASMTIAGLRVFWNQESRAERSRKEGVQTGGGHLAALLAVLGTYALGAAGLNLGVGIQQVQTVLIALIVILLLPSIATSKASPNSQASKENIRLYILSFSLLSGGMLLSVATILNYSFGSAASLIAGLLLLASYYLSGPSSKTDENSTAAGKPSSDKTAGGDDRAKVWVALRIIGVLPVIISAYLVATFLSASGRDEVVDLLEAPVVYFLWLAIVPAWLQAVVVALL